ncbi:phosphatase PAP2 family protein [Xanthomarina spongicola]|uniref:Undecaprenyl-diphosphatase n=1 Tax=Xanthomarina spongicola TaxID=570520 RepID=A0A316DM86_9FLAO|nr:phosphatase PAP2 family protein [Xanthomarina spongicola]PWK18662.1 undecaprenyl-diphosphatase [Xanthomarina spongicola]
MLEQLVQLDTELFLYLNNLGTTTWDAFWMFYTTKFYWIPFYAVLLYLIFKQQSLKFFAVTIIIIVLMVTFTDQVTNLFKHGFERFRPCHQEGVKDVMRIVKEGCGGRFGYFSGHASNSMAVAVFAGLLLRHKYKNLIFFLLFWSALMGYSRIYIGVHYPLDVLSGFIFGSLSGFMFYKISQFIKHKYELY